MIELSNVAITSGTFSLAEINLVVPEGAYAVFMGGTGQGKTTILEAIAGLRRVTRGSIRLGGTEMTDWKPADRGVGYVPQDLALFPSMTVREHLEFALRVRRYDRAAIERRVEELAEQLGIGALLARHIQRLSGGEAQRVALGRALSFWPRIVLLDEPLNALDETTRDRLCELLRDVQRAHGFTALHVTHSRAEARQLADRLVVLHSGKLSEHPVTDLEALIPDTAPASPAVAAPART